MSKSQPRYTALRPDPTGTRHLLLFEGGVSLETGDGLKDWPSHEIWGLVSAKERSCDGQTFDSQKLMYRALEQRLRTELMGLRLYAEGSEAFLWDISGLARAAGMGRSEVSLSRTGSFVRRVYCVHCGAMSDAVETDLVQCISCGAYLAVRDHFSRRLAAFIGVQADAETPGELPAAVAFSS